MRELREVRAGEIVLAKAAAMGRDTLKCLQASGGGTAVAGAQSVRHCGRLLKRIIERFEGDPF
jgi:hypothetical protein